jgi:hypothetical protein
LYALQTNKKRKGEYKMRISDKLIEFAGQENLGVYEMAADYYNHYLAEHEKDSTREYSTKYSFSEKEDKLNAALRKEIMRVAGIQNVDAFPVATWGSHPVLNWAMFAVVNNIVDMIFPNTIPANISAFSEIRNMDWGDSYVFDIKPRDLFVVSKSSRLGKRTTEMQKQYMGQVAVLPTAHELTVGVSLIKVLQGKESLADYIARVNRSFEYELTIDIYNAFATAMDNIQSGSPLNLKMTGFSETEFIRIAQSVQAWNGGAPVVAMGTLQALSAVVPSAADTHWRYELDSEYARIGYIRNFKGVDLMVMPQVADWKNPFGLKLNDKRIYFLSPSSQKIVKVVLEGTTMTITDSPFDRQNLLQKASTLKSWGTAAITNAVAGEIVLS